MPASICILASAFKHGVTEEDILHALKYGRVRQSGEDDYGTRFEVVGPDRSANFLGIVLTETPDGTRRIYHAQRLPPSWRPQVY